ncbi:MAG: hypothetical protein ACYSU7_04215 [Planctomycetota bacterium]
MTDDPSNGDTKALLTPTKIVMQLAGFAVGLALLAWIIRNAVGEGDWGRIARANPWLIAALLGSTLISSVFNGSVFWITIRPIKHIGFWNLQRLNVVANMLNYAPIRLGAVARVLYHVRVDRLGILEIGAWFAAIGYTLVLGVASCLLATIVHPDVDWVWAGLVAAQLALGGMAIRVFGGLPLIVRHGRGIDRMVTDHWSLWGAIALRAVDLGAYAARMAVAAAILGIDLGAGQIVVLSLVALAASLIPFGRVGFREFCVAATGQQLAMFASDGGQSMNQLALVESAGEALVYIPLGVILLGWCRRQWRVSRPDNGDKA